MTCPFLISEQAEMKYFGVIERITMVLRAYFRASEDIRARTMKLIVEIGEL